MYGDKNMSEVINAVDSLKDKIGCMFHSTSKFGGRRTVKLEEVRKRQVKLRENGREDTFTLPIEQFNKKFTQEVIQSDEHLY